MVDTQRTVTIRGDRVIVEETSTVVGGAATRAVPTSVATSGLRALSASVLTADGRSRPFDNTVTLSAAGSLTIRARYRLTDCPDLLPVQWPTPSSFPDATRTFSRLDEPLHTAYALCSTAKSRARPLDGLTGTVVAGPVPTVRLAWNGDAPLTISTIGSASGVAVIAVEPGCDGGCVAEIPASGYATLPLQPIDPCPPATDDDIMTLAIERHAMTSVRVFGLAAAVCH
jgi:hypothetical protein